MYWVIFQWQKLAHGSMVYERAFQTDNCCTVHRTFKFIDLRKEGSFAPLIYMNSEARFYHFSCIITLSFTIFYYITISSQYCKLYRVWSGFPDPALWFSESISPTLKLMTQQKINNVWYLGDFKRFLLKENAFGRCLLIQVSEFLNWFLWMNP